MKVFQKEYLLKVLDFDNEGILLGKGWIDSVPDSHKESAKDALRKTMQKINSPAYLERDWKYDENDLALVVQILLKYLPDTE